MSRRLSILLLLLVPSISLGQLQRHTDRDLARIVSMAKVVGTKFDEFQLSATQFDQVQELLLSQGVHRFGVHRGARSPQRREFLTSLYEVLNEQQELRLHQVMFQQLMHQDKLADALRLFGPDEAVSWANAPEREAIENRKQSALERATESAPPDKAKLLEFIPWRWREQNAWLEAKLGKETAQQLVGAPFVASISFQTIERRQTSIHFAAVNPETAEVITVDRRKLRKRPVDIPDGWKLHDANKNLREIEDRFIAMAEEFDDLSNQGGMGRQGMRMTQVVRAQRMEENQRISLEWEKACRIVEELGGDPLAAKKLSDQATAAFRNSIVSSSPQFLQHIGANAEQCDRLEELWKKRSSNQLNETEYHNQVLAILEPAQQRTFKQMLFRKYWYSINAEVAFELTKVKLTEDQRNQIKNLETRLREVLQVRRPRRHSAYSSLNAGGRRHNPQTTRDNAELAKLHKDYDNLLTEIVGEPGAATLLGRTPVYDRSWQRPVTIPIGLTLANARQQYADLVKERKSLEQEAEDVEQQMEDLFELDDFNEVAEEALMKIEEETQQKISAMTRRLFLSKRIVEELEKRATSQKDAP